MLKDITLGQYIPGNSTLHNSNAVVKIIITIIIMVNLFFIKSYESFIITIIFILFKCFVSKIGFKYIYKSIKPILFIVVFTTVINIFSIKGNEFIKILGLEISYEGIDVSVKTAIRLILLVVTASFLTYTTTPISLTDGIEKIFSPLKVIKFPAHEIAMMMSISIRFIPVLIDETERIMKAQISRGVDLDEGNIIKRAKNFVPILIPLFISVFKRADNLAMAMDARCYRGGEGRTRMNELKFTRYDTKVILATGIYFIILFFVQIQF